MDREGIHGKKQVSMNKNSATILFLRIDKDIKAMAGNFVKCSKMHDHHDFVVEAQIAILKLDEGHPDGIYINKAKQAMCDILKYENRKKRNRAIMTAIIEWLNAHKNNYVE